ncbi:hypothetical protein LCGC14_1159710 [marine sediment metagenome]|uniref:ParB-like N-terminal domain-containing protein n=1 Tax=marine sediment metagenome TaxID=412755 RepID=A0A0F9LY43_9ZZZZ
MANSSSTQLAGVPTGTESQLVPLGMIHVADDRNGRALLDMDHAKELAEQIRKDGLLHPITLRPRADGFELIAGRHRLEAFKLLGWTHAPSWIKDVDDYQTGVLRLSENVTRSQLSPAEEAWQLAGLLENTPGGVDELAARTGRNVNWILDRLEMADWPDSLMQAIHHGKISLAAAKSLVRIPDPELRELRIHDAARSGINARTASLWLQQALGEPPPDSEVSENWCQTPSTQNEITSFQNCFCCRRSVELEHMRPVRICVNCVRDLEEAAPSRKAQPLTPNGSQPQERSTTV